MQEAFTLLLDEENSSELMLEAAISLISKIARYLEYNFCHNFDYVYEKLKEIARERNGRIRVLIGMLFENKKEGWAR